MARETTESYADREPVRLGGRIVAAIQALLGLAMVFGLPLSAEQVGAILLFAGSAGAAVTELQRQAVWPDRKVNDLLSAETVIDAIQAEASLPLNWPGEPGGA